MYQDGKLTNSGKLGCTHEIERHLQLHIKNHTPYHQKPKLSKAPKTAAIS